MRSPMHLFSSSCRHSRKNTNRKSINYNLCFVSPATRDFHSSKNCLSRKILFCFTLTLRKRQRIFFFKFPIINRIFQKNKIVLTWSKSRANFKSGKVPHFGWRLTMRIEKNSKFLPVYYYNYTRMLYYMSFLIDFIIIIITTVFYFFFKGWGMKVEKKGGGDLLIIFGHNTQTSRHVEDPTEWQMSLLCSLTSIGGSLTIFFLFFWGAHLLFCKGALLLFFF